MTKCCSKCRQYKSIDCYGNNKTRKDNLNPQCKIAAREAKRRSTKLIATPSWIELKMIEDLYEECRLLSIETGTQHHVDHIIPLNSNKVCGLHCLDNLQILSAKENHTKSNKVEG